MTKAQAKVYAALQAWLKAHPFSPSLEELARILHIKSVSTVHVHLQKLIEQGKVRRIPNGARSLELVPGGSMEDDLVKELLGGYETLIPGVQTVDDCDRLEGQLASLRTGAERVAELVRARRDELRQIGETIL